jgi:class 3 adenylate cyclase
MTCPNCGRVNDEDSAFCGRCGTSLRPSAASHDVRKIVTLVFTDVAGSTAMAEGRDPEVIRAAMSRYFSEMRAIVEEHGGIVEKFVGDAVMAAFGVARAHEDDALRGVRAAAEMRAVLARLNVELLDQWGLEIHIRTGVNTGEVIAGDTGDRETFATGDTVNTAARLEQSAPADEILLGETTYRLVEPMVDAAEVKPLSVKGKKDPLRAWRLNAVSPAGPWRPSRLDTPLVGRERELAELRRSLDETLLSSEPDAIAITGEPGIGKSRLAEFFLASMPDAILARANCFAYGATASTSPILSLASGIVGLTDGASAEELEARVAGALAGDTGARAVAGAIASLADGSSVSAIDDVRWGIVRLVRRVAASSLVVAVVEDVQWASPSLRDVIDDIAGIEPPCLCFLLVTGRQSSDVPTSVRRRLALPPVDVAALHRLVDVVAPDADTERVELIVRRSGGNPMFAEELARQLTADLGSDVPVSLAGVIAGQLDALTAQQQAVAERAALIGERFDVEGVRSLIDDPSHIEASIAELEARGIVHLESRDRLAFHHALYRDELYRRMPKHLRAELHERFARVLESGGVLDEEVAVHLELAYRSMADLRTPTPEDRRLADRAIEAFERAAADARRRSDHVGERLLLERALSLAAPGSFGAARIRWLLAEELITEGHLTMAVDQLQEARAVAQALAADGLVAAVDVSSTDAARYLGRISLADAADRVRSLIAALERFNDAEALAIAWRSLSDIEFGAYRFSQGLECAERCDEYNARAGRRPAESVATSLRRIASLVDDTPVSVVRAEAEAMLSDDTVPVHVRAEGLHALAVAAAYVGDRSAAEAALEGWGRINAELGMNTRELLRVHETGVIRLMLNDLVGAADILTTVDAQLAAEGEQGARSSVVALLARTRLRQGRPEDAAGLADLARSLADAEDVHAQAVSLAVAARVAANAAQEGHAIDFIARALAFVDRTDHLLMRAEIALDHAAVLDALGDAAAADERSRAVQLLATKGVTIQRSGFDVVTATPG